MPAEDAPPKTNAARETNWAFAYFVVLSWLAILVAIFSAISWRYR